MISWPALWIKESENPLVLEAAFICSGRIASDACWRMPFEHDRCLAEVSSGQFQHLIAMAPDFCEHHARVQDKIFRPDTIKSAAGVQHVDFMHMTHCQTALVIPAWDARLLKVPTR